MYTIRKARKEDSGRIAEILVFSKRLNYRKIFNDDYASFNLIQVYPLAQDYLQNPNLLENIWVFEEEGIVKGMVNIQDGEVKELYADSFFTGQGIGSALLKQAVSLGANRLWVLEKNERAINFYYKNGFSLTGRRLPEEGTPEYIMEMVYKQ